MDTAPNLDRKANGANQCLINRLFFTAGGKTVDMIEHLHCDVFNQPKFLINGVDVRVRLVRSKDWSYNEEFLVHIKEATLIVRRVKISPGIHYLNEGLNIDRYDYPNIFCLFAFDLTPDLSVHFTSHWNLVRSGFLRVELIDVDSSSTRYIHHVLRLRDRTLGLQGQRRQVFAQRNGCSFSAMTRHFSLGDFVTARIYRVTLLVEDRQRPCSSATFGIHWFEGNITLRKLQYHLYNLARTAKRIYVKGLEKARYVESITTRNVENLDDYTTDGFGELQRRFKCPQVCSYRGCQADTYKRLYCALLRAHILRKWIHSHVPSEILEKIQETGTDAFYQAIQKPMWSRRFNTVQFRGRDVVDKINSDEETCGSDDDEYVSNDTDSSTINNEYGRDYKSPRWLQSPNNRGYRGC
ncbi:hypothetical protein TSAR_002695 [Trichomalopsis sarcophagae]|uniref:Uncharacterized protein n=1 Tax=Trichomalopsis sarcophagae TaxID=543379 RepID=A0A232ERS8_9HYME|nr:hypothetical protein TSAR_002695 [Trichomalopsis sarcophagae]